MNKKQSAALVAAGLSAGLVLGSVGVAVGTPDAADTTEAGAPAWHRPFRAPGERIVEIVAGITGLDLEQIIERRVDGESLNGIITSEGADPADVIARVVEDRTAFLEEQVAADRLTEEEAADILAEMPDRMSERMDATELPPRREHGRRGPNVIKVIADLTDLEPKDIVERRAAGESFADIASSAGSSADAVLNAAIADAEAHLTDAVDAGRLTEEQKADELERLEENLPDRLSSTDELPPRGAGPRRGDGPGMPGPSS